IDLHLIPPSPFEASKISYKTLTVKPEELRHREHGEHRQKPQEVLRAVLNPLPGPPGWAVLTGHRRARSPRDRSPFTSGSPRPPFSSPQLINLPPVSRQWLRY